MRPELGVSKPASMRSSVVLPQPDEPSRAKISPLAMSRLTLFTALKPLKSLTTFSICRKACGATAVGGALVGLAMKCGPLRARS